MAHDIVVPLNALLEEEYDLLKSGAIDRLGPLSERKEALLATIKARATEVRADDLESLSRLLGRNAKLIQAAQSGLRQMLTRLRERQRVVRHFDVYTAGGKRQDLQTGTSDVERKA